MAGYETQVLKEIWDVDRRLAEIGVTRAGLLRARDVALSEAATATPNHCANAPGTFSYQQGTWALRDQFVGRDWEVDRTSGVEAVRHRQTGVRIVFSNVDVACDDEQEPTPRSGKGAGSERVCQNNLFGYLPRYTKAQADGPLTYYLMMDEEGACELSCPVISNGTFSAFVERLFLSDGDDFEGTRLPLDDSDVVTDFDPLVVRKA